MSNDNSVKFCTWCGKTFERKYRSRFKFCCEECKNASMKRKSKNSKYFISISKIGGFGSYKMPNS